MKNSFYVAGKVIKKYREALKLTQDELANLYGKSRVQVNGWEQKEAVKFTKDEIERLAKILKVNTEVLTHEMATDQDVPESIYRDLVEANSEYRLVPKTILQEEYRIMLKSEIDYKEQLMREALESKNNFITYLKQQITELQESLAQHSIAKKA